MNKKQDAIIFKTFTPVRKTVVLFEKDQGKQYGVLYQTKHIPHGAIVNCVFHKRLDRIFLSDIEIVHIPIYKDGQHILFLHHVLELCDFFIPFGFNEESLFDFLYELITSCESLFSARISKSLVLFRICVLLGIYPEDTYFNTQLFHKLAQLSMRDIVKYVTIDNQMISRLDSWIHACIISHPFINSFKTIRFLTDSRNS